MRWTACSGVEGDLSEEWSELFSTMFSPSGLWGVGERERLRRTGEQAGVLRFELLAVLQKQEQYPINNHKTDYILQKEMQMIAWTLAGQLAHEFQTCGAHVGDAGLSFV